MPSLEEADSDLRNIEQVPLLENCRKKLQQQPNIQMPTKATAPPVESGILLSLEAEIDDKFPSKF